jgi:hypothetical protein
MSIIAKAATSPDLPVSFELTMSKKQFYMLTNVFDHDISIPNAMLRKQLITRSELDDNCNLFSDMYRALISVKTKVASS